MRSSRVTLSPSYTKWFSSSIDLLGPHSGKIFVESFREKKIERSRGNRKEAVTWGLESDNLPSIFSADLSKVFSTFLWPMYATSTLLFLITVKASPAHKLTYYFSSIVEQLLKRSTLCANRRTTGHTTMLSERGKNALITSGFSAGTLLLSRQTKMQLSSSSVRWNQNVRSIAADCVGLCSFETNETEHCWGMENSPNDDYVVLSIMVAWNNFLPEFHSERPQR